MYSHFLLLGTEDAHAHQLPVVGVGPARQEIGRLVVLQGHVSQRTEVFGNFDKLGDDVSLRVHLVIPGKKAIKVTKVVFRYVFLRMFI